MRSSDSYFSFEGIPNNGLVEQSVYLNECFLLLEVFRNVTSISELSELDSYLGIITRKFLES